MPAWLLSLFSGLWGYVAIAIGAAAVSGYAGAALERNIYSVQVAKLQTQLAQKSANDATASIDQLKKFISTMSVNEANYSAFQTELQKNLNSIQQRVSDAIKAKSLPADCVPDKLRQQSLVTALDTVNSAALGN